MPKLTETDAFIRRLQLKEEEIPSYHTFPFDLPVIRHFQDVVFHPNVTYIIGENGMGKSTLLEAIAVAFGFNPEGGTRNFRFSTYDSHSPLDTYVRLVKGVLRPNDSFFFRAETFYNVATNIEEMDKQPQAGGKVIDGFGGKSLHEQSHGQAFFAAFMHRFRGNGLYILDEPEAALSPLRQMSMLARIHELVENGSQFIISTHAPMLMGYPDAKLLELTEDGMQETTLEQTSHYTLLKQFIENRDRLLHHLFE
ncbi:AAA family ATPase [Virgibacillus salexigens]|uniref:ABC transporter ATP-binding protein n=1 Tax=Virgibacillus kapii TaxID=1638645 RepID=A0ABQ2DGM7_9BACI|nr:AAA family ATPase [Virgibacillus kapii]GGJ55592.1 ABC transporter ATP-binding protein [Virgibacillus kapii]